MNGFRNQGALTLITRIKPGEAQTLRNLLAQMVRGKDNPDVDVETNDIVPFAKLTTIHFARFVVVDQSLNESGELEKIDPFLVLATNYDKPLDRHLEQLVDVAGEGLDRI